MSISEIESFQIINLTLFLMKLKSQEQDACLWFVERSQFSPVKQDRVLQVSPPFKFTFSSRLLQN